MTLRFAAVVSVFLASACATPKTYLRVATATEADFERVSKLDAVWYEFQPGDTVPFNLFYFGAIEGGAADFGVKAKSPFYLVAYKDRPIMVSYDGENVSPYAIRSIIAVTPRHEGSGGAVNWVTYLGEGRDPERELQKLLEKKRAASARR
ncbi:MAG: hypothetical protein ACOZQL_19880 [Myxococcota bacterium]